MQKEFEMNIDGKVSRFVARTGVDDDVGIFEIGAQTPSVVLTESNGFERLMGALVDKAELLDLAIAQTGANHLIERARRDGVCVSEAFRFAPPGS